MLARRQREVLALGLGLALALLIIGFALFRGFGEPGIPQGAIAFIEDAPEPTITAEAVAAQAVRSARLEGVDLPPTPGGVDFEPFRDTALNELILNRWVGGEAEELGIDVAEGEVAAELQTFIDVNFATTGAFELFKQQNQLSDEDISELVTIALISDGVNETFDPEIPGEEDGPEIPGSLIEAYYEQNRFLYELVLDGDPTDELVFATVDQVRELIIRDLRPGIQRTLIAAARRDFEDKWRDRTFCAPGFAVERCSTAPRLAPEGAPPVISTSPIAPSLAGVASVGAPDALPQTPFPEPIEPEEDAPSAPSAPRLQEQDLTPQLLPPPSTAAP